MRAALLGAVAACVTGGAASASTVTLDFVGQDPGAKNVHYHWNGSDGSAKAGQFKFEVVGSDPLEHLLAFCIDLANVLDTAETDYETDPGLLDPSKVTALDKLFTQHYASVVDAYTSAGFQVAIWELITDATYDLADGTFKLTGGNDQKVIDAATDFLVLGDETGGYNLTFLDSVATPSSQDLVTVTAVPLPASALLLGAGLFGIAGLRRLRRD